MTHSNVTVTIDVINTTNDYVYVTRTHICLFLNKWSTYSVRDTKTHLLMHTELDSKAMPQTFAL
jgi:hypothetical protein